MTPFADVCRQRVFFSRMSRVKVEITLSHACTKDNVISTLTSNATLEHGVFQGCS